MKFKRERSYLLYLEGDLVILDGLNNNADVFRIDDFSLVNSLSTKENNCVCALTSMDMLYLGCHNRLIQLY